MKKALILTLLLFPPYATAIALAQQKPATVKTAPGQEKSQRQQSGDAPALPAHTVSPDSLATAPAPADNAPAAAGAPEVIITGHEVKGVVDSTVVRAAIDHYYQTRIEGFQQSGLPRFIITGRERKFLLGIGGFVSFRTSYDFMGGIDNRDFITYDIPVPGNESTRQHFNMDATASRLFFKAIANSQTLGQVVSYIETDFRNDNNAMRLRYAYIQFGDLLFGRSVTTFCDLGAAPTTVDAEGPNSYTFNFNNIVRYTHVFKKGWSAAVSAESPSASITTTDRMQSMNQRLPDIPAYVQYEWTQKNVDGKSHLRFSSVIRELRYYDSQTDRAHSMAGWGIQLSGAFKMQHKFSLYMQSVYGHGIARYIQDIADRGLDIVPDPRYDSRMELFPMGGWFGALQYSLTSQIFICAGYSHVEVFKPDYHAHDDTYHRAQYFFSNIFMNIGSSCTVGMEYLHGSRRNMNDQSSQANRLQAMIQYNF